MATVLAVDPSWPDVALQALNVVQVLALAYLARGVAKNAQGIQELKVRSDRRRKGDGNGTTPGNAPGVVDK